MSLPAAIILINDDITANVQAVLVKQLYITSVMTGADFDTVISNNPGFIDFVHLNNQRVMVLKPFTDLTNRNLFDLVCFVQNGVISVEKNNYGPVGLTFRVSEITFFKLGIINTNFPIGENVGQNLSQTLFYGPHSGGQSIILDSGDGVVGDGYIRINGNIETTGSLIGPASGDLSGSYPNPSVIAIHSLNDFDGYNDIQLLIGNIEDGYALFRSGNTIVGKPISSFHASTISNLSGTIGATEGTVVWVDSLACLFSATPDNLAIADNITVIQGVDVQWQRIEGSSSAKWLTQIAWYIDSFNGDDENDGSASFPLKTADEIQRRLGPNPLLKQSITITVIGSLDLLQLYARTSSKDVTVKVIGITSDIYSYNVTTISDVSGNIGTQLRVDPITDWGALIKNRIIYGTANNSMSWVAKSNPGNIGNNIARVTPGYYFNNIPIKEVPSIGDSTIIQALQTTITHLNLNIQIATNENSSVTYQSVVVKDIKCDGSLSIKSTNSLTQALVIGCDLNCAIDVSTNGDVIKFVSCIIESNKFPSGSFYGCLIDSDAAILEDQTLQDTLFQNCTVSIASGEFTNLVQCQIFDGYSDALTINPGATANVSGYLSGAGSTGFGAVIINGGELIYAVRPTILGTAGQLDIAGSSFLWNIFPSSGILPQATGSGSGGLIPVVAVGIVNTALIGTDFSTARWDGYAININDRVLLPFQTNQSENGIYERVGSGLVKTSDSISFGSSLNVINGDYYADAIFSSNNSIGTVWRANNAADYVAPIASLAASGSGSWHDWLTIPGPTSSSFIIEVGVIAVATDIVSGTVIIEARNGNYGGEAILTSIDPIPFTAFPNSPILFQVKTIIDNNIIIQVWQNAAGGHAMSYRVEADVSIRRIM